MIKKALLLLLLTTNCYAGKWEDITYTPSCGAPLQRMAIPHGWLVMYRGASPSITFVPDEKHEWKLW